MDCPFCGLDKDKILLESRYGYAIYDGFPISPGHILVIPKHHTEKYFDLSIEIQNDLNKLVCKAKEYLDKEYHPDGYNIGINNGTEAGQTVEHLHIHLIPRYAGDQEDPRGGIRWVIQDKANYWDSQNGQ